MTKKKTIIILCALAICILASSTYILVFLKPTITIDSITVDSLQLDYSSPNYVEGHDPIDSIIYEFEMKKDDVMWIQTFINEDELPSLNVEDYARVTIRFSVVNTTIFDAHCNYLLINNYDTESNMLIVNDSNVVPYIYDSMSTTSDHEYQLYIYTKDKTHEEIEKAIKSIEFQMPFTNDIVKNSNTYFGIDDVDIEFNGL